MKYKLQMREFKESDTSSNCPFMPDEDSSDIYLNALMEDISTIPGVSDASLNESIISIITTLDERALKSAMKPALSSLFCKIRLVSLTKS